jgi:hypothetical protein
MQFADEHLGVPNRLGLTADLEIGLSFNEAPQALPHDRMVVDDQHTACARPCGWGFLPDLR